MRIARRSITVMAVAIAILAAPASALAVDPVAVAGTVVRDAQPVTGVEVVVTVAGSDIIASAVTDEQGAFAVQLDAEVGAELHVSATGQTSRSGPDGNGCVRTETPIGELAAVIDAVPPAPLTVELDTVLRSEACGATGTPPPADRTPRITLPATDLGAAHPRGAAGNGLLLTLGALAVVGGGSAALVRRRG